MIRFSADWILPISDAPIGRGVVAIDEGRIVSVETGGSAADVALGRVALPGLVNAHAHLELSYLHRRIPPAERFLDWVRPMLAARRERPAVDDKAILHAAQEGIRQARAAGTALIGDVTNTLVTVPLLREAEMAACVFHELIGFAGLNADEQVSNARRAIESLPVVADIRFSLAPHAPYSVSPRFLRDSTRTRRSGCVVSTVHVGESPEEIEFLKKGTGPWRTLLEELGVWNEAWQAPQSSPVEHSRTSGFWMPL